MFNEFINKKLKQFGTNEFFCPPLLTLITSSHVSSFILNRIKCKIVVVLNFI